MTLQSNRRVYQVVVVVWLTLSVASIFLAIINWTRLSHQLQEARQAYEIQDSARQILRLLIDCETGQRGYCLTRMDEFLTPLNTSRPALQAEFDTLIARVQGDPSTLQKAIHLRGTAELVMTRIDDAVKDCARHSNNDVTDITGNLKVKEAMDMAREEVARLGLMRQNLIAESGEAARRQIRRATMTSFAAGILGIVAGVFALWLARVTLEHQRREKELIAAKLQAERSSQEKTVFLANMSHEIRTPMNAILGFSELLAADLVTPRQRHYLGTIRQSANALLQLISDILDMAKIEAGVLKLDLEPTDAREICHFVHAMFTEMAARKNLRLECLVAEDLPGALLLDRIRLRQVLVNLVGNAIRFTNKGKVIIRVNWEKSESTSSQILLIIEVQDTGLGIPQDKLEAIFSPFVQAGAHRDIERHGTGIGLAIVRRLTEMMGGTVTAASVPGQGSVFHLRIPEVSVSLRLPVVETSAGEPVVSFNHLRPSSLLVADDDENNCELIAAMFAETHHRLTFAHDGLEAVAQARNIDPDVILLDIRMPGLDGREALAQIRKIPALELTPVIAVTAARATLAPGETDLRELFNGYLRKPFTTAELFAELSHFIPRHAPGGDSASEVLEPPWLGKKLEPASPALLVELQALEAGQWPAVRDSGAVNDARTFAAGLQALAEKHQSEPLRQYARTLSHCAENYRVVHLEKLLARFPELLVRLRPAPEK